MPAHQPLDLWTTCLPVERWHPHFRSLAANPVDRACFQRWADDFPDVNGNAAHELQTKFSPMFWEICLFKMFQTLGFTVSRPNDRPDFVLETPQGVIAAEAKIIDSSPGQSPVWTPIHEVPLDRDAYYEQTCAKLSGALHDKLKHFRTYSDEPAVKDRPFLLCVNPYDTPHFVMQGFGAMTRVLYQSCDPQVAQNSSGDWVEVGHRRVESFTTKSGTVVPFGFFLIPATQKSAPCTSIRGRRRASCSLIRSATATRRNECSHNGTWFRRVLCITTKRTRATTARLSPTGAICS